jgi:hypothetical protein
MQNIFPEKKLGFGLMRLPLLDATDDKTIDVEQVKTMVDMFLEKFNHEMIQLSLVSIQLFLL